MVVQFLAANWLFWREQLTILIVIECLWIFAPTRYRYSSILWTPLGLHFLAWRRLIIVQVEKGLFTIYYIHKLQLIRCQGNMASITPAASISKLYTHTHKYMHIYSSKLHDNLSTYPLPTAPAPYTAFLTHKIKAKRMTLQTERKTQHFAHKNMCLITWLRSVCLCVFLLLSVCVCAKEIHQHVVAFAKNVRKMSKIGAELT